MPDVASGSAQGSSPGTDDEQVRGGLAAAIQEWLAPGIQLTDAKALDAADAAFVWLSANWRDLPVSAPSERDVESIIAALPSGGVRDPILPAHVRAVLSAVPSRPGGDAERVLEAVDRWLTEGQAVFTVPDDARDFLRENRDRILREAGQEWGRDESERQAAWRHRLLWGSPDEAEASVAGPGTGTPTASPLHPHEPQVPRSLDAEGRCVVCLLTGTLKDAARDLRAAFDALESESDEEREEVWERIAGDEESAFQRIERALLRGGVDEADFDRRIFPLSAGASPETGPGDCQTCWDGEKSSRVVDGLPCPSCRSGTGKEGAR